MALPTHPEATAAPVDWPPPDALDDRTWHAVRQALLAETARETVFAPHYKIVALHAFDRIRAAIESQRALGPAPKTELADQLLDLVAERL